ncbi:MAG: DMT family transporter [Actinomycetota bacterium]
MPYQLAALIAASLWATSSIIATDVVRRIGGPRFTRIRMVVVCVLLGTLVTVRGGWETLAVDDVWLVGLSGLVGLTIGDIALFTAMSQIGPRRTSVLFTANAPMAAIGGVWLFGETFDLVSGTGAVLTVVGILLAVVYGNRAGASDTFEKIEGSLPIGVFWGFMGAVGQAVGALAAKPVLDDGADTLAVAATRAIIATVAMWIVARPADDRLGATRRGPIMPRDWVIIAASGTVAMVIGQSLVLYALGEGDAGITTILSSTTPVLLLPVLWVITKKPPTIGAWIGAGLSVFGTSLLI